MSRPVKGNDMTHKLTERDPMSRILEIVKAAQPRDTIEVPSEPARQMVERALQRMGKSATVKVTQ
jgi:hypothetical protein